MVCGAQLSNVSYLKINWDNSCYSFDGYDKYTTSALNPTEYTLDLPSDDGLTPTKVANLPDCGFWGTQKCTVRDEAGNEASVTTSSTVIGIDCVSPKFSRVTTSSDGTINFVCNDLGNHKNSLLTSNLTTYVVRSNTRPNKWDTILGFHWKEATDQNVGFNLRWTSSGAMYQTKISNALGLSHFLSSGNFLVLRVAGMRDVGGNTFMNTYDPANTYAYMRLTWSDEANPPNFVMVYGETQGGFATW